MNNSNQGTKRSVDGHQNTRHLVTGSGEREKEGNEREDDWARQITGQANYKSLPGRGGMSSSNKNDFFCHRSATGRSQG